MADKTREARRESRRRGGYLVGGLLLAGAVVGLLLTRGAAEAIHATNTTEFCTSCHVYEDFYADFKQDPHFANAAGVGASCGDCHVPKQSWFDMVWTKAWHGSGSAWSYWIDGIDTPREFAARRPDLQESTHDWFVTRDSQTCRNCHAVAEMDFAAQSAAARASHQVLTSPGGPTCVACHQDVPHGTAKADGKGDAADDGNGDGDGGGTG
jgi:nitrate/TMAO reductase-like tetraheme cytochrome c subunit